MPLEYTRDALADRIAAEGFEIGDYTYGVPTTLNFGEGAKLVIGRFCSIAGYVRIFLGGNHRLDWVTTYPFTAVHDTWPEVAGVPGHPRSRGDVRIGHDVWLGEACTIMSGVTIGHGAVVAAGALVSRDVQPYAIVGGNPARLIRYRFSPSEITRLLRIAWWDWPEQELRAMLPLLTAGDIAAFIDAAEPVVAAVHADRVAAAAAALGAAQQALDNAQHALDKAQEDAAAALPLAAGAGKDAPSSSLGEPNGGRRYNPLPA